MDIGPQVLKRLENVGDKLLTPYLNSKNTKFLLDNCPNHETLIAASLLHSLLLLVPPHRLKP